jgi:arylsulfatase A-like enzyme
MPHACTRSPLGRVAASLLAVLALAAPGWAAMADPAPAHGRPDIVLILIDDAAFMDLGTYGGEARTPNIDALAAQGAVFTGYHTSPLCSPSRAMLLTGIDNHKTGVATIEEVIPPEQLGKPGYTLHFEPGVLTVATRLKAAGYRTYMTGKWHLGHGPGALPHFHGFDRSLALDASGADNWQQKPYMPYYHEAPWFEDGKPTKLPAEFYSSQLLVDRMLEYLRGGEASGRPFFAYIAFQAVHIPVQAPRSFTDHYAGVFDGGWDELRRDRWQRAQQMGLIPKGAPLEVNPPGLRPWSSLTDDERRIYSRSMSVYAGMIEAMDQQIGRLVAYLKARGQFDNTIFVVTSDNGPAPSDPVHARGMGLWMRLHGYTWNLATLGERGSLNFIGPEWAASVASPGWLFKFYTTEGGLHVPLIISGPGTDPGVRSAATTFVTDVTPTLLDLAGVDTDRDAPKVVPIMGRSLRPLLEGKPGPVHDPDEAVGFEVSGNAALFLGEDKLVRNLPPWGDGRWRVFDLAHDPGETTDLTEQQPELAARLMGDYRAYAARVGVLALPAGYSSQRQLEINVIERQLHFFAWPLTLTAAALAALIALAVARWRRRGA